MLENERERTYHHVEVVVYEKKNSFDFDEVDRRIMFEL